jgi:hypothetical protein
VAEAEKEEEVALETDEADPELEAVGVFVATTFTGGEGSGFLEDAPVAAVPPARPGVGAVGSGFVRASAAANARSASSADGGGASVEVATDRRTGDGEEGEEGEDGEESLSGGGGGASVGDVLLTVLPEAGRDCVCGTEARRAAATEVMGRLVAGPQMEPDRAEEKEPAREDEVEDKDEDEEDEGEGRRLTRMGVAAVAALTTTGRATGAFRPPDVGLTGEVTGVTLVRVCAEEDAEEPGVRGVGFAVPDCVDGTRSMQLVWRAWSWDVQTVSSRVEALCL